MIIIKIQGKIKDKIILETKLMLKGSSSADVVKKTKNNISIH